MVNPFDNALQGINQRFGVLTQGGSPFGASPFGSVNPFTNPMGGMQGPNFGGFGNVQSPFGGAFGNMGSPFGNAFGSVGSPFGGAFGNGSTPFGQPSWGTIKNPFTYVEDEDPLGTGGSKGGNDVGFTGTSDGTADSGTARWRPMIEDVARQLGISDPDVIQAVMMIESQGNPQAGSSQGAIGLMQIIPAYHASRIPGGGDPWDPYNNIYAGAHFLRELYQKYGSWDKAAAGYLGGMNADGTFNNLADANGTTGAKYAAMFNENMRRLKAAGVKDVPALGGGNASGLLGKLGGGNVPITQEIGETDYSRSNPYNYGADFGYGGGHHGLDLGYAADTQLRTPVGGTVVIAGGSGYYTDERYGNRAGTGELRLRLDNGHELILGHLGSVNVRVGQRVAAGQVVGRSGVANGPHLHLEYRIPDKSLNSGWRAVDPRQYIR